MLVAGYNCEQEMCASCCHGADTGEQKRQTARKYTITNCKKNNERNREAAEIENNGGEGATSARAPGKESWSFPVAAAVNYAIFPPAPHPCPSSHTAAFLVPSATLDPRGLLEWTCDTDLANQETPSHPGHRDGFRDGHIGGKL